MKENNIVVFYHKHCVDGTSAAAVLLHKFPNAKTIPLDFVDGFLDIESAKQDIFATTQIFFVDTTLGLEEVKDFGSSIVVIDHHVSEKDRVEKIARENNKITYIFDNEESGATLAFKYFFPQEKLPVFLTYVKDIDLWQKKFTPESEWLHQYLSLKRNMPEKLLSLFGANIELEDFLNLGKILIDYIDLEIEFTTKINPLYIKMGQFEIPAFNITNHQSKAGNILSLKYSSAVILYSIMGDKTRFSIRSFEGCFPNSRELASMIEGGGGHDHAAGATIETVDFLKLLKV